jgi:hypothetical protein
MTEVQRAAIIQNSVICWPSAGSVPFLAGRAKPDRETIQGSGGDHLNLGPFPDRQADGPRG